MNQEYLKELEKEFKEIHEDFKLLEKPIEFDGFRLIGYFPYNTASIRNNELVWYGKVFKEIEEKLMENYISDNKAVYIFERTKSGQGSDFALKLFDFEATIGSWNQVVKY